MPKEEEELRSVYGEELSQYRSLPYYEQCKEERYLEFKMINSFLSWTDIITYVNLELDTPFYTNVRTVKRPGSLTVLVNKHNRLSPDYVPLDLEEISPECSLSGLVLRHSARLAFERMCGEAACEGIYLTAISTFRSFDYQEKVYWSKKTPAMTDSDYQADRDKVSARPGFSEHQTGLAVDINDLEETFEYTAEGKWLACNSYRYGFVLRYPKGKEEITGYSYEPWHFRYAGAELASDIKKSGLTYDEFYIRCIRPI